MSRYLLIHHTAGGGENRFELEPGASYRLGAKCDNDVVIPDDDVSRHHAILRVGDGSFHITDLNSKNGTFVNGTPVTDAAVRCGDLISLSSARLVVVEVSSGAYAMVPEEPGGDRVEPASSDDTSERTIAVPTEEVVALIENLSDAVSSGRLTAPLTWAVEQLGMRAAVLLYVDEEGGVSLLTSAGDLGRWATESAILARIARDQAPSRTRGSGLRHVSELGDELLVCRVTDEHVVVFRCPSAHPPVDDVRAVVAATQLLLTVERVRSREQTRLTVSQPSSFGVPWDDALVGVSPSVEGVRRRVQELGRTVDPVVVVGEPGVGKRSIAVALHHARGDATGPLVEVVCEHDLGENGSDHVASSALEPEPWDRARGGSLVVVGAHRLPQNAWRAILERATDRAGDVRLVATWRASRRGVDDLPSGLRPVRVHPLRERTEDLPLLIARWSPGRRRRMWTARCLEALSTYRWPDNLRELYGEVRRIMAELPPDRPVDVGDLAPRIRAGAAHENLDPAVLTGLELADARRRFEAWFVRQALQATDGNQTRAAERLGLSRAGLFRKLRRLDAAGEDIS